MKKYLTIFLFVFFLISACSASDDSQGVVSTKDLSSDTTVTTIVEETAQEVVSVEDAQLLLARCLRENGYDITCLLYTSPSPRDKRQSRMPSSA